jgi:plasmid stability protein
MTSHTSIEDEEIRAILNPCSTDLEAVMANLTITVDDDLLRRARIRALEQGTSVNALLRTYLGNYADADERNRAVREFLDLARSSTAGTPGQNRTWTRDELYDR